MQIAVMVAALNERYGGDHVRCEAWTEDPFWWNRLLAWVGISPLESADGYRIYWEQGDEQSSILTVKVCFADTEIQWIQCLYCEGRDEAVVLDWIKTWKLQFNADCSIARVDQSYLSGPPPALLALNRGS